MKAYIHTHSINPITGLKDTFSTLLVDCKIKPLPWQIRGLQYTATGYGSKIPTRYMVRFNDKWRRVYCMIYSNNGTLYIGKGSDNLIIDIEA